MRPRAGELIGGRFVGVLKAELQVVEPGVDQGVQPPLSPSPMPEVIRFT